MSKAISLLLARVETLAVEKKEVEDRLLASYDRHENELRNVREDLETYRDKCSDLEWELRRQRDALGDLQALPGFQEFVAAAKKAKEDAFIARMNATAQDNFNMILGLRKLNKAMIRDLRNLYDNNHKINAIKEAREFAKVGLKEAKDFVEHLASLNSEELEKVLAQAEKDYEVRNPLIPSN